MLVSTFATFLLSALAITANPVCNKPTIRKEWRTLSTKQQKAFVKAVKCLSNLPHTSALTPTGQTTGIAPVDPNSSLYDDLVYAHMDTNSRTHFTGRFFAWHRWYLNTFESFLKIHCGYKGGLPYWDWSQDVDDMDGSPVFNSNPHYGLGTWGTNATNFVVTDGAFASTPRAYPTPHFVAREYRPKPFENQIFPLPFLNPQKDAVTTATPSEISYIINNFVGDFEGFMEYIEGIRCEGLHNAMHLQFGPGVGDLADPSHSPNDIMFFLHHNSLDRLWAKWQAANPANAASIGGGTEQALPQYDDYPSGLPPAVTTSSVIYASGLTPDITIADIMNTQGGYLCYRFDN
ncbi:hypothetical protein FRC02_004843 [Tulasnella sp. 418]|nr:hypothetical protein FRC02_004843 [Tulasnella sp. 418]